MGEDGRLVSVVGLLTRSARALGPSEPLQADTP